LNSIFLGSDFYEKRKDYNLFFPPLKSRTRCGKTEDQSAVVEAIKVWSAKETIKVKSKDGHLDCMQGHIDHLSTWVPVLFQSNIFTK
jgi:hypothetical protein